MFEYLNKLNPDQRKAATHIEGPLLIIAGAGSGKTTVLINRVAYMIDSGIDPKKILLLTFTNAAAQNMVDRAAKMGNERCKEITACTFHSFCAMMLRIFYKEAGLDRNFSIITGSDCNIAYNIVKTQLGYNLYKKYPTTPQMIGAYSFSRNTGTDIREILSPIREEDENLFNMCLNSLVKYQEYKEENNLLDYDDLLFKFNELLNDESVRHMCECMYPYVSVDEYQDTNHVQEDIVFKLTKERRNLTVVGDDYQSIYAFRGSDISGIINFPNKAPGCEVVKVLTNYRSTPEILEIPNKMMERHARFGYPKVMDSGVQSGTYPVLVRPDTPDTEAKEIFSRIERLLEKKVSPSEIAVLSRGSQGTAYLEAMLAKNGIPFVKHGGKKFFDLDCINDVLSIFRCIVCDTDTLAWFNVLDLFPGIGKEYASRIIRDIGTENFLVNPDFSKRVFAESLKSLKSFINGARHAVTHLPLIRVFEIVSDYYFRIREEKIEKANVLDESHRTDMENELKNDRENVEILKGFCLKYLSVTDFLDGCVLDAVAPEDDKNCIVISTIHSAKGMEWDYVFVRGLVNEEFIRDPGNIDAINEELRCLYVALTRARKQLTMSAPKEIVKNGKSFESTFICFLDDVISDDNVSFAKQKIKSSKVYLSVPYANKDIASKLGAKFDWGKKLWFVPADAPDECKKKLLSMFPPAGVYRV